MWALTLPSGSAKRGKAARPMRLTWVDVRMEPHLPMAPLGSGPVVSSPMSPPPGQDWVYPTLALGARGRTRIQIRPRSSGSAAQGVEAPWAARGR